MYTINEIFYSVQGEGVNAGRPAVFCRFSGCNLWTGRERDRPVAVCKFCDTDFVGTHGTCGGKYQTPSALVEQLVELWPTAGPRFVVLTGGEPLLQVDSRLLTELHANGFEVAVETNGTIRAPDGIDWLCVSPKTAGPLVQNFGTELKLVFPQVEVRPEQFVGMYFGHFLLQPMDGPDLAANTALVLDYCKRNPLWRVSLQLHKVLRVR